MVHRPFMGPVTAVARAERLDYVAGRSPAIRGATRPARRSGWPSMLVAHVNVMHEPAYDDRGPGNGARRGADVLHPPLTSRQIAVAPPSLSAPWRTASRRACCSSSTLVTGLAVVAMLIAAQPRHHRQRDRTRMHEDQDAAKVAFDRLIERRGAFAHQPEPADHRAAGLPRPSLRPAACRRPRHHPGARRAVSRAAPASDFLLVADRRRHVGWAARTGRHGPDPDWAVLTGRTPARPTAGHSAASCCCRTALYLVVLEPARFVDEVLGWLAVGYRLDDGLAAELASEITHADVNLMAGGRLWGSSLEPARRRCVAGSSPRPRPRSREWLRARVRRATRAVEYPLSAPRAAAGASLSADEDWAAHAGR